MRLRATSLLVTLAASLLVLCTAPAGADASCSIVEQVTSTTGGGSNAFQLPAADADGDRVAFVSNRDLTGGNPDLNGEIFLADLTADTTVQVTDALGGGNPSFRPEISDDGTKVVFESSADLTGDNADGSGEVFLYNSAGSTLTQLTDDPTDTFFSGVPDISGDGTKVAFVSDLDPNGSNPLNRDQVFLVNTSGPLAYTQLTTAGTGESIDDPSVNQTGSRVAYSSTANPVPATGNADGNREVFVVDPSGPTTAQLTKTTGETIGSGDPELSEDGTRVTFVSNADLTGGNADGNEEVFRRTIATTGFLQLTDTTTAFVQNPSSDQTGARTILRHGSPEPRNADGSTEVLAIDVGVGGPSPITANPAGVDSPGSDLSDDGLVVALTSEGNPLGTNPDGGLELFVARCGPLAPSFNDVPTTNPFFGQIQWMDELGIASGFPGPTYRPADPVKRQQMANFMYNLAGQPAFTPPATPTFNDVPTTNPFFLQIEWMVDEGIASGFPGGLFKPNEAVKRQQMANFMYNLGGQPLFSAPGSPSFVDVPTSNAFYLQVEWMFAEGIASGFPGSRFKPSDPVIRQQMANFMHNFAVSPGVDLSD